MTDREPTFVEHLEELRRRIILSLVSLGLAALASLPFAPYLLKILKSPAGDTLQKLAFFGPEEAFLIYMRVGFLSGFVIAFPVIIYQLWAFVAPAVEERFKRYAGYFILAASFAFLGGCLFSYFILLPKALTFLLSFGSDDLVPVISAGKYISFVTGLIFASGVVFEMPVLSFFLTKMGVINPGILRKNFRYAVIVIAIFSAVITPTTDIFNMMVLMIPMLLLYEVSIWVSYFAKRRPEGAEKGF